MRNDLKTWLNWMRDDVGFQGWRFDFVKGYSGKYTVGRRAVQDHPGF